MRIFAIAMTAYLSLLFSSPALALKGKILSISDGDTLQAQFGSHKATIRFACIDAPEMRQKPWGGQSRNRLRELLPIGEIATFSIKGKDKYNRFIAEVLYKRQNINIVLVREGKAVIYKQYLKNCNDKQILKAENQARTSKRGFWNQSHPVMPWVFRRMK